MAAQLIPPRHPIDIAKALDYVFIGEFELLRFSRDDIRNQPWAQPGNREAMQRYFRIKAAQDEICRLNTEIRRLVTSIADESSFIPRKIKELSDSNPYIASEIQHHWNLRQAVNQSHLTALSKLKKRHGFTGTLQPGTRIITQGPIVRDTLNSSIYQHPHEEIRYCGDLEDAGELSEDDEIL